ncbi:MarR family winged helix-turn-helix transcriptional regulator [Amycolatopsis sp. FDAARGOS 1241]|uniref:MarR family winged helix-turn-helix transcriptional regulator n=1 Tax=Amycolatopsis sp. FDAARGOS 1241 TaxID=2778070 RepID=UPI001951C704|nr:MarR family transcriptional regulator [Amycolatopsis sp. FDAARGOS 1241]QRP48226.1 MarR family transcriptional regulator [Amycolatopsis sp. FDAARGOS 1241]
MTRPRPASGSADVDTLTDAVLTASRLLVGVSVRSIAAVGDRVTLAQFRMLVVLHTRGPLKHAVLADHLGVTPSTASRMVDRLVAAGLVHRQHSTVSRREIVLAVTEEGARVVRQVTARRRRQIAKIVAKMPEEHRRGLVEALTAFTEAGGEPPAATTPEGIWG